MPLEGQREAEVFSKEEAAIIPQQKEEEEKFEVKLKTYCQYFLYHPFNFLLFPLAILTGASTEFLMNYFLWVLSDYDKVGK